MENDKISVVIICRDAAATIEKVIASSFQISEDVLVIDSGSTDGTLEKVKATGARLVETVWQGYGATKNYGNTLAKNNWIFSLDADEYIDAELALEVSKLTLTDNTASYTTRRINYLGNHAIRFGEWGKGSGLVHRLFNRTNASWDTSPVHEKLLFNTEGAIHRLGGSLHHYTSPDIETYQRKLNKYATLMAEKYRLKGKKATPFKRLLSPLFNFTQNYVFKGGFLDGKDGWKIARAHARYTFLKYQLLHTEKD